MELQLRSPHFALETGEIASLDDAVGLCIHASLGQLWVTEENVTQDFVIGPGEVFRVTQPGRTLVQAIKPAWITIKECQ